MRKVDLVPGTICADHRGLEGAAQYREHLQQGVLGLGGRQQQHLAGPAADLPLQGHRQVVRGEREPRALFAALNRCIFRRVGTALRAFAHPTFALSSELVL